jgi:VWFA-related protein
VLLVVSDGQDNFSRHTREELLSKAIESEAQIYTVATPDPVGFQKAVQLIDANRGLALLSDLARITGGLSLPVDSSASVAAASRRIVRTLHEQYVIGYYPAGSEHPGARRIQVKLDLPDVRLYARNRYYPVLSADE